MYFFTELRCPQQFDDEISTNKYRRNMKQYLTSAIHIVVLSTCIPFCLNHSQDEHIKCENYHVSEATTDNETLNCLLLQPGQYPF